MWYVIQTFKGREKKDIDQILKKVTKRGENVFVIENEKMFRVRGEWIKDRKPLFPGYIFVETEVPEDFDQRLRIKLHPLKLIHIDGVITPIRPEEEEYLKTLGGEDRVVLYSEGFRVNDKVEITSGSFKGFQGEIRKLDRHNRSAKIVLSLMGQDVVVEIGLGITRSIASD